MSRSIEKPALVLAMLVGTFLMWTAVPAAWLWIAGRFARVSQSDMTSIALVFSGIPATMVMMGKGLGRLERRYEDHFSSGGGSRNVRARWLQSLRGNTPEEAVTMLDKILIINIALALIFVAVWLLLFSGGSQVRH